MAQSFTAQHASALEQTFRAITRGPVARMIETDGLFDMVKLQDLQRSVAHDPVDVPIVDLLDATTPVTLQKPDLASPTIPSGTGHYIFNDVSYPRARVEAFQLSDVFLSFDVQNNGRVEFYVFTKDGALINGLFFGARPFLETPLQSIDIPCVLIDDFFPKPNICHFLFDKYPRKALVENAFGPRTPVLFHQFPYGQTVLEPADIQLISLAKGPKVRGTVMFKDLVVLSDSFHHLRHPAQIGAPGHLAAIQNMAAQVGPTFPAPSQRRIMLKRAAGLPRNIVNADEIEAIAERHGFEMQDPGAMSVPDQIDMFRNCSILVGVHGAGLANLAYQPPQSKVVEILPPLCATKAYWIMAQAMSFEYAYLVAHDPEFGEVDAALVTHNTKYNNRDVVVPPAAFDALLAGL
jgi:hypothetical protein